jgi:hypothetical protein
MPDITMKIDLPAVQYTYYYFKPTPYDQYKSHFGEKYDMSIPQADRAYKYWLNHFYWNAQYFYKAQFRIHQRLVEQVFYKAYDLPDDWTSDGNISMKDAWDDWIEQNDLDRHYKYSTNSANYASAQVSSESGEETGHGIMDRLNLVLEHKVPLVHEIDELWFNTTVSNNPDDIKSLKGLDYALYLKTPHWRKVRAALLLIRRGVCQASDCWNTGESWMDEKGEPHVHHLSYRNRGCERYSDVALLCEFHHKKYHSDPSSVTIINEEGD